LKALCSLFILVALPLNSLTPRLLIALDTECAFSAFELAQNIDACVISGSEKEMESQILALDAEDGTHQIILDSPVENLAQLASRVFYDYICLHEEFEAALKTVQDKICTVPVTDADLKKISPEDRGLFYSLLKKVSTILDRQKVPFWAISGTLLGAVRHQGMVPWDDDLDIIIRVEEVQRFENLAKDLNKIGLQLYVYGNYFYKIFTKDGNPIYKEDGSLYPWKYPFLDVFVVNELQGKIRIVSHNYPLIDLYPACGLYKGWWLYPHELLMPQLFLPFGPMPIPVPHDPQAILTREYGSDWNSVAYMWHNHASEKAYQRIKVQIRDYSPPKFIMPKG